MHRGLEGLPRDEASERRDVMHKRGEERIGSSDGRACKAEVRHLIFAPSLRRPRLSESRYAGAELVRIGV